MKMEIKLYHKLIYLRALFDTKLTDEGRIVYYFNLIIITIKISGVMVKLYENGTIFEKENLKKYYQMTYISEFWANKSCNKLFNNKTGIISKNYNTTP